MQKSERYDKLMTKLAVSLSSDKGNQKLHEKMRKSCKLSRLRRLKASSHYQSLDNYQCIL